MDHPRIFKKKSRQLLKDVIWYKKAPVACPNRFRILLNNKSIEANNVFWKPVRKN